MIRPVVAFMLLASFAFAEANPIFVEISEQGVAVEKGDNVKLPAPTMPDGLDAAGQHQAMKSIADANHTVDALLRKAVVAPLVLKIAEGEPGGTGRRVDLWFVAYGDLKTLVDSDFLGKNSADEKATAEAAKAESSGKMLTPDELSARKIEPLMTDGFSERFATAEFPLFDRVRIRATSRAMQTRSDESVIMAFMVDPRFAKDVQYPNQWHSIERDDAGKTKPGPTQPYSGAGGYGKATQLKEPAGAIFVEYHLAFDEPPGWFHGANLLRSKLPIVAQDNVRKLRRKLQAEK